MSYGFEIKTKSMNGLPIWELLTYMTRHNMENIEHISWNRLDKNTGYVVYEVMLHERV